MNRLRHNGGTDAGLIPHPLRDKLAELIDAWYPNERTRPGYARLAAEIREHTGHRMSGTYLWELATGRKQNVTQETLRTLATFFDVPVDYLLDDRARTREPVDPESIRALRDPRIRAIAVAASGLSKASLDAILTIVEQARTVEHLNAPDRPS